MPVYLLGPDIVFPPVDDAEDGLLAVGGDLGRERLLAAYARGIFPWYSEGQPILWHSPDPRFVLLANELHVPRSLERAMRRNPYEITLDRCFERVVDACAVIARPGQSGTWITSDMRAAYLDLHRAGYAHSVETWLDDELVGGLYGVSLGRAYFGESMFARAADASKVAFVRLVRQLDRWGIRLIDCQVETAHLARFGARSWPRSRYVAALRNALLAPSRLGTWSFDLEGEAVPDGSPTGD